MKKTTIAAALIAVLALSGCAKVQNTPIIPEANKNTAQSSAVTTKVTQNTQTTANQDSNKTTSNINTQPAKPEHSTNNTKAPSTQPVKTVPASSNTNTSTTTKPSDQQTDTSNQGRIISPTPQPVSTGSHGGYGITTNEVLFSVISDISVLPEGYRELINNYKMQRGYFFTPDGDDFLMTISSGERSTGGYGIKVVSVEDIEGITKVIVEETTPPEGAMVIQALTYPAVTIKVPLIHERVQVVNTKGEKFDYIKMIEE